MSHPIAHVVDKSPQAIFCPNCGWVIIPENTKEEKLIQAIIMKCPYCQDPKFDNGIEETG